MATESKVGRRIRTFREKLDMSIYDLAQRSGIDEKVINSIEKGEVLPALGVLTKLSRALGQRLGTFMDDQFKPDPIITRAKDLPFAAGDSVELDFRLVPGLATKEKRPRCAYVLAGVDGSSGENIIWNCMSVNPETGLRGMWESVPPRILGLLSARGRMPGEIKVVSGRMFRLMRPLCMEIPFRLSLHDRLPRLEAAYLAQCDPSRFVV